MQPAMEAIVGMKFSGMKACAASIRFSNASPLSRGVAMLHANDSFNSKLVELRRLSVFQARVQVRSQVARGHQLS